MSSSKEVRKAAASASAKDSHKYVFSDFLIINTKSGRESSISHMLNFFRFDAFLFRRRRRSRFAQSRFKIVLSLLCVFHYCVCSYYSIYFIFVIEKEP